MTLAYGVVYRWKLRLKTPHNWFWNKLKGKRMSKKIKLKLISHERQKQSSQDFHAPSSTTKSLRTPASQSIWSSQGSQACRIYNQNPGYFEGCIPHPGAFQAPGLHAVNPKHPTHHGIGQKQGRFQGQLSMVDKFWNLAVFFRTKYPSHILALTHFHFLTGKVFL